MSLRTRAAADFRRLVNKTTGGFGHEITITAPDASTQVLTGYSTDISATIDPDTGQLVSGRTASISVAIEDLANQVLPVYVPEEAGKPWRVTFDDVNGNTHEFKVRESLPDRAMGSIVLILESYSV